MRRDSAQRKSLWKKGGRLVAAAIAVAGVVGLSSGTSSANTDHTCMGVRATIVGTSIGERINGTSGRDVIVALGGNDVIYAGGGNDLICAGAHNDFIDGGPGNDTVYGEGGNDRIDDAHGDDRLFGGPGDDRISDAIHTNRLDGGSGNNVIRGPETRSCMGQPATWVGSGQDDVYWGTGRDDVIIAGSGNDQISGGGGHDLICGGDGNDVLRGNSGIDTIFGGNGNDRIEGGHAIDVLYGQAGHDVIEGNEGPDILRGDDGNDVLRGGAENDDLHGGSGYDRLSAGPGHNHCNGGEEQYNCEANVATKDYLNQQWADTDQVSFGQVAWLRYELKKDNVGGPYTGQISDATFNRLGGVICQRSCVSVTHNRATNAVTIGYRHNVSNVIATNGQIRYVPPPPNTTQVPARPPTFTRNLSGASGEALNEMDVAETYRDETLAGARKKMLDVREALSRVNNPLRSQEREARNYEEQTWRLTVAVKNAVDAQKRYDEAVQRAYDEHKASEEDDDSTVDGGSGGGEGGGDGSVTWPVSCGTCP